MADRYIDINIIAKLKGYTTNRPIRQEINKPNSKYTARKVKKQGGFSYEILFSSLESELQDKILDEEMKSKALVPINNNTVYEFRTEKLKLVALTKIDVIKAFEKFSLRYEKNFGNMIKILNVGTNRLKKCYLLNISYKRLTNFLNAFLQNIIVLILIINKLFSSQYI